MITIKELRKKTQGHISFPWPDRLVSVYFTWFFIHTPISANQITLLDLVFGLIGCVLIGVGNNTSALTGGIFFMLFVVFDDVDGEVARFKKSVSKLSYFMESLCHPILHPLKFLALGFGLSRQLGSDSYMILAIYLSIIIFLELAINWRREIFLKGEYSYARIYKGYQENLVGFSRSIFNFAAFIMQEVGMYFVIFLATMLDFFQADRILGLTSGIFSGLNFKAIVLVFYSVTVTVMMAYNLKKTRILLKRHFREK